MEIVKRIVPSEEADSFELHYLLEVGPVLADAPPQKLVAQGKSAVGLGAKRKASSAVTMVTR